MLLGGMGDRQKIICRGLSEYEPWAPVTSYSLDTIIQNTNAVFYDLEATIIWMRRVQYHLDTFFKCSCSSGYSLECLIQAGHPNPTTMATYNVFKVKVPEYDENG